MTLESKKPNREMQDKGAWRAAVAVAAVSGLFCLVVATSLIVNFLQITATDPLDNPELLRLREELAASPEADPALVEQIRALDLLSRKAFFTSQAHLRLGGRLLLIGAIVFLAAFRLAARWNPKPPAPSGEHGAAAYWNAVAQSKELITGSAVILVLAALTAAYMTPMGFPRAATETVEGTGEAVKESAPIEAAAEPGAFPDWDAVQQQWPSLRGPGNFGVAHFTTAPTEWDVASGKNIRWNVEAPATGFNSPVVWDNRLFISSADERTREVLCYDTETGEQLWRQALPAFDGTPESPPEVTEDTGYAAPTMCVHGDRAFAIFGTGDLACYDFGGQLLWGRNVGVPDNHYGHSSSLIALDNLLYVQMDDHSNPRLMALDVTTGEEVWAAKRERISWASPSCIPTPFGLQVVLAAERNVDAYDPASGNLLWTVDCLDGEVAPSPAFSGKTVFVANDYAIATALRLSESAEGVQAEAVWEWEDSLPDVASPVGSADYFYIATSMGEMVCLSIESGGPVWLEEFEEGFYASPVLVGERLYAMDREGVMHIIGTGSEFQIMGSAPMGEPASATPAFLDNRMYVRTLGRLLCIENND